MRDFIELLKALPPGTLCGRFVTLAIFATFWFYFGSIKSWPELWRFLIALAGLIALCVIAEPLARKLAEHSTGTEQHR